MGHAMAAGIQKRVSADGKVGYRAQVRLRGFPAQSATFPRLTDAKTWIETTKTAIRDGRYFAVSEARKHTLGELVDRRIAEIQHDNPGALPKQKLILTWWKEKLGAYSLANVTPELVAETLDKFCRENIGTDKEPRYRKPGTRNRYHAALSVGFTRAVKEWRWARENPLRNVSKKTETSGRVRFLSDDERLRLLKACEESALPELMLIVMLALTTGMRRSEILGLRWPDVNLERRLIVLNKTKNRERRSVPIVPAVEALLIAHGKVRRLGVDAVFPNRRKKPKPGDAGGPLWFDEFWYAALAKAGIDDFRFHDLRHTAASYLAMSGATTAEIAAVLGHKTLQMVKRYAHLSDQHTGKVVQRMTNKFFGT